MSKCKSEGRKDLEAQLKAAIAKRIVTFRKSRYVRQSDAVEGFDYQIISDYSTWSRLESGERMISALACDYLHREFDVDLNWLISGDNPARKLPPPEIQEHLKALADYFIKNR